MKDAGPSPVCMRDVGALHAMSAFDLSVALISDELRLIEMVCQAHQSFDKLFTVVGGQAIFRSRATGRPLSRASRPGRSGRGGRQEPMGLGCGCPTVERRNPAAHPDPGRATSRVSCRLGRADRPRPGPGRAPNDFAVELRLNSRRGFARSQVGQWQFAQGHLRGSPYPDVDRPNSACRRAGQDRNRPSVRACQQARQTVDLCD